MGQKSETKQSGRASKSITMSKSTNQMERDHRIRNLITCLSAVALCLGVTCSLAASANTSTPVLSSRAAFLRAQQASRQLQQANNNSNQTSTTTTTTSISSSASTSTSAPSSSSSQATVVAQPSGTTSKPRLAGALISRAAREEPLIKAANLATVQHSNRTTRTADVFQSGEGYNIFVTNTCEREQMHVKITTSREFNGVIHTRNQRSKSICTVEGNGGTDYTLDISHVLNTQDPNYCGVVKARRDSPADKDLLSVVIAVRFHRNIELSDDKFFLLNCTNRCRKSDCSAPSANNKLLLAESPRTNGRVVADEIPEGGGERETATTSSPGERRPNEEEECTIWKFPWLITLLWCMGILLLAMIISHCIMCSSLVCRCVKTEVEEREPSVYEDDETDDEDKLYNRKNHPMRIDYDNRDIYKTSNNYEPYRLDETRPGAEQGRARKSKSSQRR